MTTHVLLLTQDQTKRTLPLSRELSFTICQRLRHLGEEDDGEERGKRNLLISLRAQTKTDDWGEARNKPQTTRLRVANGLHGLGSPTCENCLN